MWLSNPLLYFAGDWLDYSYTYMTNKYNLVIFDVWENFTMIVLLWWYFYLCILRDSALVFHVTLRCLGILGIPCQPILKHGLPCQCSFVGLCDTWWTSRSILIHLIVLELLPLGWSRCRTSWVGATPMQAKWIKLDLVNQVPIFCRPCWCQTINTDGKVDKMLYTDNYIFILL